MTILLPRSLFNSLTKFFPNCGFILEMKKVEFISDSSKETQELEKYFISQILRVLSLDKALVVSLKETKLNLSNWQNIF